ncbi:MAG: anaerobic ribonucleoside-triphosphate reductase activating protein [Eubacterium sp.]|nr:anaerobic ribonucleoside-triphosphate reductase activating protein [Eubacterium sp.]
MNYAELKEYDIANGPGIRLSLFVSGCTHHCKGCFNEVTWDFNFGRPFTPELEDQILDLLDDISYRGLTLLGGEPFEPGNQRVLLPFLRRVKARFPKKDIWCFTGYLLDRDLLRWELTDPDAAAHAKEQRFPAVSVSIPETAELLSMIDVLVDGEYMEAKKDITLLYKGSANQRTIDVPKTLAAGKIIQWDPGDVSMSKTAHL